LPRPPVGIVLVSSLDCLGSLAPGGGAVRLPRHRCAVRPSGGAAQGLPLVERGEDQAGAEAERLSRLADQESTLELLEAGQLGGCGRASPGGAGSPPAERAAAGRAFRASPTLASTGGTSPPRSEGGSPLLCIRRTLKVETPRRAATSPRVSHPSPARSGGTRELRLLMTLPLRREWACPGLGRPEPGGASRARAPRTSRAGSRTAA